jgi:hypothetical protein
VKERQKKNDKRREEEEEEESSYWMTFKNEKMLKIEGLDRSVWRFRLGGGYGPDTRQTTE